MECVRSCAHRNCRSTVSELRAKGRLELLYSWTLTNPASTKNLLHRFGCAGGYVRTEQNNVVIALLQQWQFRHWPFLGLLACDRAHTFQRYTLSTIKHRR